MGKTVISITTVYRDENGKQMAVDIKNESTGEEYKAMSLPEFFWRSQGCEFENFVIVDNSYVRGSRGATLNFVHMLTVEEIWKRYPEQKVCLSPYITKTGTPNGAVKAGVVFWHGSCQEAFKIRHKYMTDEYRWVYTMSDLWAR